MLERASEKNRFVSSLLGLSLMTPIMKGERKVCMGHIDTTTYKGTQSNTTAVHKLQ